jgi:hypothetical protein
MCCFAGATPIVSRTEIFARTTGPYGFLVYAMSLKVDTEVAMILPVPVDPGSPHPEKALAFLDFSHYEAFFKDLNSGFPVPPPPAPIPRPFSKFAAAAAAPPPLPVEKVGSFEASFVPTMADFTRLDPRFQLAPGVWEKLPGYHDHGFAVFRLPPGATRIHPMAFRFRTRHPDRVFFPTVHVHDGEVHETAAFDHRLYYQLPIDRPARPGEERSARPASDFVADAHTKSCIRMKDPVYRQTIHGDRPNRDTFVD